MGRDLQLVAVNVTLDSHIGQQLGRVDLSHRQVEQASSVLAIRLEIPLLHPAHL